MKTTLLSILFIASIASFSFSQIEMSIGVSGDIEGTQIDYTSAGGQVGDNILVTNKTGSAKSLTIQRERINETPGWTDDLCWGPAGNGLGGACYTANDMPTNPWTTPNIITLENDSVGSLIVHMNPTGDFGCTVYRYRVMEGSTELAYLDISVCKSADVENLNLLSVSMAPNPANSNFTITTNSAEETTFQIVDVLGNVVLKETIMGNSKAINTGNFRNGVYFVRVTADNQRTINRKVIVRH